MSRLFVLLTLMGLLAGWAVAAEESFSLSGRLGATDQESQEGYFAIGNHTMIVVKPDGDLHAYLRSKVGQRVRVTVELEGESE